MARQAETRNIDGLDVTVQQLPARAAEHVFHRLMSAVGPALAAMTGKAIPAGSILDADIDLGAAINLLFDRLTWPEMEAIQKELLATSLVSVEGKTIPLMPVADDLLAGKIGTLLKITAFAIEVNFKDLFQMASSATGLLAKVRSSTSPKPSPATGPVSGS